MLERGHLSECLICTKCRKEDNLVGREKKRETENRERKQRKEESQESPGLFLGRVYS